MLQCIAVDDEPLALSLLEDYISNVPYLNLVAKGNDAFEAIKLLQENTIDLVFIDIQMPGMTGLQLIKSLAQKPMFILVTAYEKFALEGYRLDVVDYLVKPVQLDQFMQACNKAWELFQLKSKSKEQAVSAGNDYIFLNVDYSLVKIMFDNIKYVEGLRDYIKVHLKNAVNPIVVRMNVTTLEESLPAAKFLRVHKSYIVSIDSITAIRKNSVFINELEIPIGATYREAINDLVDKNSP